MYLEYDYNITIIINEIKKLFYWKVNTSKNLIYDTNVFGMKKVIWQVSDEISNNEMIWDNTTSLLLDEIYSKSHKKTTLHWTKAKT